MIFVILNIQAGILTLFAVLVILRVIGRDDDSAMIVGRYCGLA